MIHVAGHVAPEYAEEQVVKIKRWMILSLVLVIWLSA